MADSYSEIIRRGAEAVAPFVDDDYSVEEAADAVIRDKVDKKEKRKRRNQQKRAEIAARKISEAAYQNLLSSSQINAEAPVLAPVIEKLKAEGFSEEEAVARTIELVQAAKEQPLDLGLKTVLNQDLDFANFGNESDLQNFGGFRNQGRGGIDNVSQFLEEKEKVKDRKDPNVLTRTYKDDKTGRYITDTKDVADGVPTPAEYVESLLDKDYGLYDVDNSSDGMTREKLNLPGIGFTSERRSRGNERQKAEIQKQIEETVKLRRADAQRSDPQKVALNQVMDEILKRQMIGTAGEAYLADIGNVRSVGKAYRADDFRVGTDIFRPSAEPYLGSDGQIHYLERKGDTAYPISYPDVTLNEQPIEAESVRRWVEDTLDPVLSKEGERAQVDIGRTLADLTDRLRGLKINEDFKGSEPFNPNVVINSVDDFQDYFNQFTDAVEASPRGFSKRKGKEVVRPPMKTVPDFLNAIGIGYSRPESLAYAFYQNALGRSQGATTRQKPKNTETRINISKPGSEKIELVVPNVAFKKLTNNDKVSSLIGMEDKFTTDENGNKTKERVTIRTPLSRKLAALTGDRTTNRYGPVPSIDENARLETLTQAQRALVESRVNPLQSGELNDAQMAVIGAVAGEPKKKNWFLKAEDVPLTPEQRIAKYTGKYGKGNAPNADKANELERRAREAAVAKAAQAAAPDPFAQQLRAKESAILAEVGTRRAAEAQKAAMLSRVTQGPLQGPLPRLEPSLFSSTDSSPLPTTFVNSLLYPKQRSAPSPAPSPEPRVTPRPVQASAPRPEPRVIPNPTQRTASSPGALVLPSPEPKSGPKSVRPNPANKSFTDRVADFMQNPERARARRYGRNAAIVGGTVLGTLGLDRLINGERNKREEEQYR